MFIFGDRTIKKAVSSVLKQKVNEAQSKFNDYKSDRDLLLEDEIAAARGRHAEDKALMAEKLAREVLGN